MRCRRSVPWPVLLGLLALCAMPSIGQIPDSQLPETVPIPPPLPPRTPPQDAAKYDSIVKDNGEEWGLPTDLIAAAQRTAAVYEDYAKRFECDEEARSADYDSTGVVSKEKHRIYSYLLLRGSMVEDFRESRQQLDKKGEVKRGEIEDAEPFPPAYAWVFLFSPFFEPYFDFQLIDTRFEGFDLVHEIQFRGSLPFTDGKDIRQWEGRVLVDHFRLTPLLIEAEPTGQKDRLEAIYRLWSASFNLLGFRTGKKPLGYQAEIQFGFRKGDLNFPTALRYDTRRVVAPNQLMIVKASTRSYSDYKFFGTTAEPKIGGLRTDKSPKGTP